MGQKKSINIYANSGLPGEIYRYAKKIKSFNGLRATSL